MDTSTAEVSKKATERLWQEYAATRDLKLRERLILQYAPLVKYVVGRLAINLPTILESEDILSAGTIGLISAVERFDPHRGVKFETYAIARIRGAIIDELRSLDWIPRSARQRAREIEQAVSTLEAQLGRMPTDEEVAAHLNMDVETYFQALLDASVFTLSLDSPLAVDDEGDLTTLIDVQEDPDSPDPVAELESAELVELLKESIKSLPERDQLILSLYYIEELTMKEISQVLHISESRVCQVHSRAIIQLRAALHSRLAGQVPRKR